MRKAKVFSHEAIMPRMSWSAKNLYNLIARSTVPFNTAQTSFTKTSLTMYQQRWRSKRFLRAYHGDWIPEKRFKRWFLPTELPRFVPPQVSAAFASGVSGSSSSSGPRRGGAVDQALKARRSPAAPITDPSSGSRFSTVTMQKAADDFEQMPTASLFMRDVERRLDVVVFRSCFARSAYESRALVIQGKVKLNGIKCENPNQLLQPGDMISIDPKAVPMLSEELAKKSKQELAKDIVSGESPAPAAEDSQASEVDAASDQASSDKPATTSASEGDSSSSSPTQGAAAEREADGAAAQSADSDKAKDKGKGRERQKEKERVLAPGVLPFNLPPFAAPFLFIPPYLEVSFTTCSAIYIRHPTIVPFKDGQKWSFRTDLPSPYPAGGELYSMAWEYYTRNAPRVRADARRIRLEAKVGRSGFDTQRAKDLNSKRVALRRGWGRTKQVAGWRDKLTSAHINQSATQARRPRAA